MRRCSTPRRSGWTSTFIQVSLDKRVASALRVFEETIDSYPEVMECYLMTGDSDYLLRVVAPDLKALQSFIVDRLARIACLQHPLEHDAQAGQVQNGTADRPGLSVPSEAGRGVQAPVDAGVTSCASAAGRYSCHGPLPRPCRRSRQRRVGVDGLARYPPRRRPSRWPGRPR